ncbi:MAG: ATP-binding protein [Gemmatimonadetes bacterium]|nr:ATP-binding protein [Gemmatimonadota bacterium]
MTWRVVVTGSECTGKTTLARRLAAEMRAPWVAEAARRYAESRHGALSAADVEPIAIATRDALAAATAMAPAVLVADTDLVSTVVYARAYYGACPAWIEAECRAQLADLYLLCLPDLPWEPDGVRDRPADGDRLAMHEAFTTTLRDLGARVEVVAGAGDERTTHALQAIRAAAPHGSVP